MIATQQQMIKFDCISKKKTFKYRYRCVNFAYLASGKMIFLLALAAGVIFDFSIAIR